MKTCVLCFSRRKALQWMIRSRSRWYSVRTGEGPSLRSRPRLAKLLAARGESADSSSLRRRATALRSTSVILTVGRRRRKGQASRLRRQLFDGYSLCEVPWLIHIAAAPDRYMVGESLERQRGEDGIQEWRCFRQPDDVIGRFRYLLVT